MSASELLPDPSWSEVAEMLRRCGADEQTALPQLARYVSMLRDWNRSVSNLVSRADEERLVSRRVSVFHMAQCQSMGTTGND